MLFIHNKWRNPRKYVVILLLGCITILLSHNCGTKCRSIEHLKKDSAYCALSMTLAALETLANGDTNDCVDLILQLKHITSFDAANMTKVINSKQGMDLVVSALVQEVFFNAITDLMGNPLKYKELSDEEICRYVAVLCKRDIICQVALKDYIAHPELKDFHEACFDYMEMAILKHIDPFCNTAEFENRIRQHLDRFIGVTQVSY